MTRPRVTADDLARRFSAALDEINLVIVGAADVIESACQEAKLTKAQTELVEIRAIAHLLDAKEVLLREEAYMRSNARV